LKMDIEKFFDRIDHNILMKRIRKKIKDKRLLRLMERIIRNTSMPDQGLPIGNLTSQFLANVYLDPLDHLIKDQWGVKGYLRYMDDFILFSDDKTSLLWMRDKITTFLDKHLHLSVKEEAIRINTAQHGLGFLGARIFPHFIHLRSENRRRSLKKMRHNLKAWKAEKNAEKQMMQSLESLTAHLRFFSPNARINIE
ncbi:RNA-directed DNA polymerase, partial [Magnetococcales bacterium HHB-1]